MTNNKPIHEISEQISQWMNKEFTWDDRTDLNWELTQLIRQSLTKLRVSLSLQNFDSVVRDIDSAFKAACVELDATCDLLRFSYIGKRHSPQYAVEERKPEEGPFFVQSFCDLLNAIAENEFAEESRQTGEWRIILKSLGRNGTIPSEDTFRNWLDQAKSGRYIRSIEPKLRWYRLHIDDLPDNTKTKVQRDRIVSQSKSLATSNSTDPVTNPH